MTDYGVWDESTRPVGPSPPSDHVYTDRARLIGNHLVEVHDHLRRELSEIRDLLGQVKQGSVAVGSAREAISKMTLRQNNWTLGAYCASYCTILTQHHGIEDRAIFPHLRRSDPALVPVVDRLESEHVVIHKVIEGVDRALVGLAADPAAFGPVQEALDILTETLLSHLAYEEQQISEPIARYGFYAGQV